MWQKITGTGEIDYLIDFPSNYEKGKKYPVLFYIHGMGSVMQGIDALADGCIVRRERMDEDMPFIIVVPYCPERYWVTVFEKLQKLISNIINSDFADKDRIYLSGASMGGFTSWNLLIAQPEWFAAAVVCCGAGMYFDAWRIKIPVIAVHGALDTTVLPRESEIMVEKINKSGGQAKLVIHGNLAHDVMSKTFTDKETYRWLLSKHK